VEIFNHGTEPINIYTCGPTVYDYVHLGNLKTFIWSDFIIVFLQKLGYQTKHIINITDIDDKIISRLPKQTHESLLNYTNFFTDNFYSDMVKMGITSYGEQNIHKVTDNVDHIETMIEFFLETKKAYKSKDGTIYFDTTTIVNNPFIPIIDTSEYNSGREIIRSDDIRNKNDFVLWKIKDNEEIKFGKKLQKGRCGWHIECSAIADKHLGKVHIKMGGCDLKFPHHSSEIAQSEAFSGQIYGDYWIHMNFLNINGEKISKSEGNVIRLSETTHNHKLLRMYLLSKSYRRLFEYNDEEIVLLKKNFINLHLLYNKLSKKFYKVFKDEKNEKSEKNEIYQNILDVLKNDFDTENAYAKLISYVDLMMKKKMNDNLAIYVLNELEKVNSLFNIIDKDLLDIDEAALILIAEKEKERELKNFQKSDKIRKDLSGKYFIEDDSSGLTLIKRF